jgi:hypothetical protein
MMLCEEDVLQSMNVPCAGELADFYVDPTGRDPATAMNGSACSSGLLLDMSSHAP